MEKRYGYCICHNKMSSLNAKGLCPIGSKEAREKSASSKGLTVKKKDDGQLQNKKEALGFKMETSEKQVYKINAISKDKASEFRTLAEIKKRKIDIQGKECELCGGSGEVDLFHIIPVGNKRFSTNPANLILSCRGCHDIWGANDWSKIVKFKKFDEIMSRLKSLDEGKYWKLKHKIEKYEQSLER